MNLEPRCAQSVRHSSMAIQILAFRQGAEFPEVAFRVGSKPLGPRVLKVR